LDEDTVRQYWRTATPFPVDDKEVEHAVRRLLNHERPHVAVQLLTHHARRPNIPATLVAESLEQLLRAPQDDVDMRRHSVHDITKLLNAVGTSPEIHQSRVAALEWAFLPALGRHMCQPKVLHRELAQSPEFFAKIVRWVFRAEGDEPRDVSDEESARATHGYGLLESWRSLPGTADDGALDATALGQWVTKAREILCSDGRLAIGDQRIGHVLSGSPSGDDGAWPHPAVRDIIEETASDDLEQGFVIGLLNSEGISCRDPNEGGNRERNVAERYERYAGIVSNRWGRTAAMLRGIRDDYLVRARDEDQRAELREDLSR